MSRVLEQFFEITKIPRQSYEEEKIRDYIYEFGKKRNLETYKDSYKNVLIKKEASKGYENYASIALQAHIDMVCEKASNVEINFKEDGIKYYIDGDIVSTHGRTSLGADDGLGVSSILTILDDDSLKHPKIEAIFTSCEEEDFSGVKNFNGDLLKARYMINLDHCIEDEILLSSAGGVTITSTKELNKIKNKELRGFKITLSGLLGGHSGEDINKGRGNSNILLFRFLKYLNIPFYINNISGGSFRLALPRESSVIIGIENEEELFSRRDEFLEIIEREFPMLKNLEIKIERQRIDYYYDNKFNQDILDFILLLPTDTIILSNSFENVVDASNNVGEIYIDEDTLIVISDIRANYDSQRTFLTDKITRLSEICKFDYKIWGSYYSWPYKKDSKIRELALDIYKNNYDNPKVKPIHAGLECGYFVEKIKDLDIISIGPNSWDFHSPDEAFSIQSLNKFYNILVEILEKCKFKIH